jgi:hypothetical protein
MGDGGFPFSALGFRPWIGEGSFRSLLSVSVLKSGLGGEKEIFDPYLCSPFSLFRPFSAFRLLSWQLSSRLTSSRGLVIGGFMSGVGRRGS